MDEGNEAKLSHSLGLTQLGSGRGQALNLWLPVPPSLKAERGWRLPSLELMSLHLSPVRSHPQL